MRRRSAANGILASAGHDLSDLPVDLGQLHLVRLIQPYLGRSRDPAPYQQGVTAVPEIRHVPCAPGVPVRGHDVLPDRERVVDGTVVRQEQQAPPAAHLWANVDQVPELVAPDRMVLGLEVEAGHVPDGPAVGDRSALLTDPLRHVVEAERRRRPPGRDRGHEDRIGQRDRSAEPEQVGSERFGDGILPHRGRKKLVEIDQRGVAQWLAEKAHEGLAPATVEKIRVIFGRSFELGIRWGLPGADKNPVRGIPRRPINNARSRFLSAEEAERLKVAVSQSRNTQLQYIVGLLLLTGARLRELLHAEWKNVDIERRLWLIPMSKTGKPRHVPLSQAAIGIINTLPRFKDCPYLVPNPATRKPFTDIKHPWDTARREAGLEDVRLHDLRHSAASFMVNSGVDLFTVGKVLGHACYQSTQRYSHLANDTLLAAVEAGAKKQAVDWSS